MSDWLTVGLRKGKRYVRYFLIHVRAFRQFMREMKARGYTLERKSRRLTRAQFRNASQGIYA